MSFGNVELVLAPRAKLHFAIHGTSVTLTTEKLSRLLFEEGHTEFCSFGLKDSIFLSETGCPSCQKCPALWNRIFQGANTFQVTALFIMFVAICIDILIKIVTTASIRGRSTTFPVEAAMSCYDWVCGSFSA